MAVCKEGLLCVHWKDTKDVLLMSNCRKQKDGTVKEVACPVPIAFYKKYMGGADHADQMIGLYDLDRKSRKWWRKIFVYKSENFVPNMFQKLKKVTYTRGCD